MSFDPWFIDDSLMSVLRVFAAEVVFPVWAIFLLSEGVYTLELEQLVTSYEMLDRVYLGHQTIEDFTRLDAVGIMKPLDETAREPLYVYITYINNMCIIYLSLFIIIIIIIVIIIV